MKTTKYIITHMLIDNKLCLLVLLYGSLSLIATIFNFLFIICSILWIVLFASFMMSDHIFENENLKKLEFKYSTAGSMTDVVGIVYFLSLGAGAFRLLFDIGWAVSHLKSIEFLAWPFISLIVGSIQIYIFMYFQIVNSSDQLNKNR